MFSADNLICLKKGSFLPSIPHGGLFELCLAPAIAGAGARAHTFFENCQIPQKHLDLELQATNDPTYSDRNPDQICHTTRNETIAVYTQ